jgi:hypothetical protein
LFWLLLATLLAPVFVRLAAKGEPGLGGGAKA